MKKKAEEYVTRKTPQFTHIRRKLRRLHVPPIEMELGYADLSTNEEVHLVADTIPSRQFPKSDFQQLYEVASIKVRD